MQKSLIVGAVVIVLGVGNVMAQHYEVDVDSDGIMDTELTIAQGSQFCFDVYLTGATLANNPSAGGVWIDWFGSVNLVSYVSATDAVPPWTAGPTLAEPEGPGTFFTQVANLDGVDVTDGAGNILITTMCFDYIGWGDITFDLRATVEPFYWPVPYDDATINAHTINPVLTIHQVELCTTDTYCDDGIGCTDDFCDEVSTICLNTPNDTHCLDDGEFCNGAEYCNQENGCSSYGNPCPAATICNESSDLCDLDTDEDGIVDNHDNCPLYFNPMQTDNDMDEVGDVCDNCPHTLNPKQEDGDADTVGDICDNCPNTPNPNQEDTYPSQGNNIGNACDCECDFTCDGDVDADDTIALLANFGRDQHHQPCTNENSCNGDINCDGNVDADDVTKFIEDFGRAQYYNPCPACDAKDWCEYVADEYPNIIVIMTDDLDVRSINDLLNAGLMTNLSTHIIDNGITFNNYFVQNPLCCPARANFLSGRYSHNNRVVNNTAWILIDESEVDGLNQVMDMNDMLVSFPKQHASEGTVPVITGGIANFDDTEALPTFLDDIYFTGHIGKYLGGYGVNKYEEFVPQQHESYVPPGWDHWQGLIDYSTYQVYNFKFNDNGTIVEYGNSEEDYQTDVISDKAQDFIRSRALDNAPFFLEITPLAPHVEVGLNVREFLDTSCRKVWSGNIRPAPRHENTIVPTFDPRGAFNEQDMSDKPMFIQDQPSIGINNPPTLSKCVNYCETFFCITHPDFDCPESCDIVFLERQYENRLKSMLAVDDMIGEIVTTLEEEALLDNTIIIFTSDNGWFYGEHRLTGKGFSYEEAIRVPLYIKMPGSTSAEVKDNLVIINDLAPTILDLANINYFLYRFDGRSFKSLLTGQGMWEERKRFLSCHGKSLLNGIPTYNGLRTIDGNINSLYVEWTNKDYHPYKINDPLEYVGLEYYDLNYDPDQNISEIQLGNGLVPELHNILANLQNCSGIQCHQLEK